MTADTDGRESKWLWSGLSHFGPGMLRHTRPLLRPMRHERLLRRTGIHYEGAADCAGPAVLGRPRGPLLSSAPLHAVVRPGQAPRMRRPGLDGSASEESAANGLAPGDKGAEGPSLRPGLERGKPLRPGRAPKWREK